MTTTTNLFLFVAISAILVASPLAINDVFADHKSSHTSNAGGVPGLQTQIDTLDGQSDSFFDAFFDIFVDTEEQSAVDSFFDIFLDVDGNRIDSFFDIFTEISVHNADVADLQSQITALEERIAELEPEPTCAECSNNFSFGNQDCIDQFRDGEVNDPDALQACFAANLIIYEDCLDSLSDEEYSMCVEE